MSRIRAASAEAQTRAWPGGSRTRTSGFSKEEGWMAAKKHDKFETELTPEELPVFLRNLAQSLEGEGSEADGLNLTDFKKLKISVKMKEQGCSVKLKVKRIELEVEDAEACDSAADESGEAAAEPGQDSGPSVAEAKKIKYKQLKKRMKKSWKAIKESSGAGAIPPEDVTRAFLEDSDLMVTYPEKDKGPEYYDRYIEAVDSFRGAYAAGDLPALQQAVQALRGIKKQCHAEYKDA